MIRDVIYWSAKVLDQSLHNIVIIENVGECLLVFFAGVNGGVIMSTVDILASDGCFLNFIIYAPVLQQRV